jgi:hypothetical protein
MINTHQLSYSFAKEYMMILLKFKALDFRTFEIIVGESGNDTKVMGEASKSHTKQKFTS